MYKNKSTTIVQQILEKKSSKEEKQSMKDGWYQY